MTVKLTVFSTVNGKGEQTGVHRLGVFGAEVPGTGFSALCGHRHTSIEAASKCGAASRSLRAWEAKGEVVDARPAG